jgi:cytochrome c biogenesis protein CcmG/thiol:disulfide interchange protein DsbE
MTRVLKLLAVAVLLGAVLGVGGCGNSGDAGAAPRPGSPAPDFRLQSTDGQTVALSDLRGHPVLLNFWATWCPPCREELPYLQDLSTDPAWTARGLEMVGVDLKESGDTVRQFMEANGVTYRVLLDVKGNAGDLYNIQGIPTTYFIDKDGIIKYVKVGAFAAKRDIEVILNTIVEN